MYRPLLTALLLVVLGGPASAQPIELDAKATAVFAPNAPERKLRQTALQHKREEVNRRDREAWAKITTKEAWEQFRDEKIALLRKSLGQFPGPPKSVPVMVTRKFDGDGFIVENVVYESRPHLVVTANLYS